MTKISVNTHSTIDSSASARTVVPTSDALSLQTLLARIVLLAFLVFLGGLLLTTIATTVRGYVNFPTAGEIVKDRNGVETFDAYYPDFRKFAITTPDSPYGTTESKFTRVGIMGIGLYVYGISNALHWIMEMKIRNFQIILLIPLLSIFVGSLMFHKRIPRAMWTRDRVFHYTVLLALFHSFFVVAALLLAMTVSDDFQSLIDQPFLYVGQILGIFLPSAFIIVFTNLFYGAVIGGVMSWVSEEEPGRQS